MRRLILAPLLALLAACGASDDRTELVVQRFFGSCQADYGAVNDPTKADGECGIMTALINRFEADNPDIRVVENVVFWPGYDQLTAQLAANGPPDLVTMHSSAISDYEARDLLEPLNPVLAQAGVSPESFTPAARAGVMVGDQVMGLPIDVWAPLWHINMNLFRKAGLVRDGRPILPSSPEEFDAHARQFHERTGKPYLVQVTDKDFAGPMRIFYMYVMQQGGAPFRDARHSNFNSPEGQRALGFMRDLYQQGHSVRNQDYAGAVSTFLKGEGGVLIDGTWMVGQFTAASQREDSALADGYAVRPFPAIFKERNVSLVDGHNWVMPRDERRTQAQREAAARFLRFFADNNFQWARTGHFPAYTSIIESAAWRALPHRSDIAVLTQIGEPLPRFVRRQSPIEFIVGEEASAAFTGQKSVDRALQDMQRRADEILQSF
ncbi:MAG: extracellular solute-binding protein [Alphaproteobacteria bacterium]|nr:extracellular solute-binding protein [Alphaproteobacteria bacterium]MBU0793650.1 extracellular solute-binding protein [Alphaproteobacteria bacterium]MBU0877717.1 extracellular solute-binding protein [Alphaproteobacteria bacterium]MBU1771171.1 extracellular solute-binding protein [Alphaproteobacteria bacterium]